jgi:hypothetical protein
MKVGSILDYEQHKQSVNHRFSMIFMMLMISFLVTIPLFWTWLQVKGSYFLVGGLIPWSDAHGYFFGGLHLLYSGSVDTFNTRRPLIAGFMATKLLLSGQSLQGVLVLQAVATGFGCVLAARALSRSHGVAAGVVMFALLLLFIWPFVPTTMTESVGLTFGATGFALLWRGLCGEEA